MAPCFLYLHNIMSMYVQYDCFCDGLFFVVVVVCLVQFAEAEQSYRRLVEEANGCQYQVHTAQVCTYICAPTPHLNLVYSLERGRTYSVSCMYRTHRTVDARTYVHTYVHALYVCTNLLCTLVHTYVCRHVH